MAYKSKVSPEARAYYSGMGYAIAHEKRGINFTNTKMKPIFGKGYAKGREMMRRNPLKYAALPKKKKSSKKKG